MLLDRQAHIALDPGRFVEPMIVVARRRNGDLVKVGISEHRPAGRVTTSRVPEDAHTRDIEIIEAISELFDGADMIGQAVVR